MLIKRERLRVPVMPGAEMHIWDELHQDFSGLINDVKSQYWTSLHLAFGESGERVPGELYIPQNGSLLYYRIDPRREFIEAGCMLPNGEGLQAFQGFCGRIKEALMPGLKDGHPHWRPYEDTNPTFDLVREEAHAFNPTPEQVAGASVLAERNRRDLLRSIFGQRNCLMENLATDGKSIMEVGQDVQMLESLGLVQKDFVVFCRDQGNQISRVSNFSQIEDATRRGFKCFSCGRPIAEERIDQLLTCTPEGQLLARPNYWLSLLLSQAMEKIRIPLEQQLCVPASDHGRVLDLFASHDGILMMFEINEGRVRLDDVFLFFSRFSYYRPDVAFYLTTQPVGPEVRQYLQTADHADRVILLEDHEAIEKTVEPVLVAAQRARFRDVVDGLAPSTRVDVGSLVYEFFFGKEEKIREVMPEAGEKLAETRLFAPQPEIEAPRPAEEHVPSEETSTVGVEPGHKVLAPTPAVVPEQPAPRVDEIVPEPARPEPGPVLEETDLAADMSMGMMQEEMLIDQPILEIQEVIDMGDAPERPAMDEEREAAIRQAIEDLGTSGILGRGGAVGALVADIAAVPNTSAALVTDDGLLIADSLGSRIPSELVAALCAEMHDQVQRGLEEIEAGRASRVLIESMGDKMQLRPAGDRAILVVREERPMREMDEEMMGTLPGEMVLREAMLKKVLEDISLIEGVRGGIVAGRDGLAIDYSLESEEIPADVLSAILSLIVVDNEKPCKRLQLYPIRQITVRTDDNVYSLIPLDKEGILITMLEPGTPREVWQNRLYAAANMLTSVFQ